MNSSRNWLRSNQGVGFFLTVLLIALLAYLWLSPWVHRRLQDGFTLGFFPIFGVAMMILLTAIMTVDARHRRERVWVLAHAARGFTKHPISAYNRLDK